MIMFDRVLLVASNGRYTCLALTNGGGKKYHDERKWRVLNSNFVDATEGELREHIDKIRMGHSSDVFWVNRFNRPTKGSGLTRWLASALREKTTVDDFLRLNNISFISMKLMATGESDAWTTISETEAKSSKDFEDWFSEAKALAVQKHRESNSVKFRYAISIPGEQTRVRKSQSVQSNVSPDEKFGVFRVQHGYLQGVDEDGGLVWNFNINRAKVFSPEEFEKLLEDEANAQALANSRKFKEEVLTANPRWVLRFISGPHAGRYFVHRNMRVAYATDNIADAKHYASRNCAIRAISAMHAKYGRMEVAVDE